jgi:hypothetical protein
MWESFDCNISKYYYDTLNEFPRVHFNLVKLKGTNFQGAETTLHDCMISVDYVCEEGGEPRGWLGYVDSLLYLFCHRGNLLHCRT